MPYAETKLAQRQLSAGHVLLDFYNLSVGGEDGGWEKGGGLVGEEFGKALGDLKKEDVYWFPDSEELARWLKDNPVSGATILVKGSRGIQMEKVLPEL